MNTKKEYLVGIIGSILLPGFGLLYTRKFLFFILFVSLIWSGILVTFNCLGFSYVISVICIVILILIHICSLILTIYYLHANQKPVNFIPSIIVFIFYLFLTLLIPTNTITNALRYRAFKLTGNNMLYTLMKGEGIIIDTQYYQHNDLHIGDIVEFQNDEGVFISRICAIERNMIEIHNDNVLINSETLNEPYKYINDRQFNYAQADLEQISQLEPRLIKNGNVFLLGDNRYNSFDSRYFGEIRKTQIKGKVLYIYSSQRNYLIGKKL
jgi:signal peptidase I, bacterial type